MSLFNNRFFCFKIQKCFLIAHVTKKWRSNPCHMNKCKYRLCEYWIILDVKFYTNHRLRLTFAFPSVWPVFRRSFCLAIHCLSTSVIYCPWNTLFIPIFSSSFQYCVSFMCLQHLIISSKLTILLRHFNLSYLLSFYRNRFFFSNQIIFSLSLYFTFGAEHNRRFN